MIKVLFTGFNGNKNSSKVLLDNINKNIGIDLLFLENDFEISKGQLIDELKENKYDIIISFGQKPVIKSIYIEIIAANDFEKLDTNYNFIVLKNYLKKYYKIKISENAGNYLCNNIYYNGLKYIFNNKLKIQMIFIHIPYINNIDIKYFSKIMEKYIENINGQMSA
jgi:pyroglutamyl-peptidase